MAPMNAQLWIDSTGTIWAPIVVSIVVSALIAISMILVITMCCCGDKDPPILFYSVDPKDPDYCPDCAYVTHYGYNSYYERRGERSWQEDRDRSLRPESLALHSHNLPPPPRRNSHHPENRRDAGRGSKPSADRGSKPRKSIPDADRTIAPEVRTDPAVLKERNRNKPALLPKQKFQSRNNPAYNTLFEVKSDVFNARAPFPNKAPAGTVADDRMNEAQKNPAYRTLYGAESNVFDRGGKNPGAKTVSPQRAGAAAMTESRMKAAQANPAYKTLFQAQSRVFDKTKR